MAPVRRSCHQKAMTVAAVRGFVTRKHVRRKSGLLSCAHNKITSSFCSIRRVYRTRTERPKRTRATLGFHRRNCWQTRRFFRCVDFFLHHRQMDTGPTPDRYFILPAVDAACIHDNKYIRMIVFTARRNATSYGSVSVCFCYNLDCWSSSKTDGRIELFLA